MDSAELAQSCLDSAESAGAPPIAIRSTRIETVLDWCTQMHYTSQNDQASTWLGQLSSMNQGFTDSDSIIVKRLYFLVMGFAVWTLGTRGCSKEGTIGPCKIRSKSPNPTEEKVVLSPKVALVVTTRKCKIPNLQNQDHHGHYADAWLMTRIYICSGKFFF